MDEIEFRTAVQSGLGRGILYTRGNDVREFQEVIADACVHCYSADVQIEGTRAPYMLELARITPDFEFYRDEVLKALALCGDDWDTVQRYRFASYLAMDGDQRARQTIYEHFDPGPQMAEEMCIDLMRMDGLDGFLFAAEKMGTLITETRIEVDDGWLLYQAIEAFGEDKTLSALRTAGKLNERVEAYRVTAEKTAERRAADSVNWRHERDQIMSLHYEELRPRLFQVNRVWLSKWGEQASEENLVRAAQDLMKAVMPEERLRLSWIFHERAFPLDHDVLLRLARSENRRVALASASALGRISHPSVREFAIHLVETLAEGRQSAIAMLARNWEPGDHELVLSWFEREQDRGVRHRLGMDLRKFWERHPEPGSEVQMLLALYEKGPCSACREFLLRRLIELNAVPDHIRAECVYDASIEVRQLMDG